MSSTDLKPENLGTWFKCQREEFELSQGDAAEKLGFSLTTVVRIESGEIPWASISNKPEYRKPIEELFGYYPALEETAGLRFEEYRTSQTPAIQNGLVQADIRRQIDELEPEIGTKESSQENHRSGRTPDDEPMKPIKSEKPCIVGICAKCQTPVLDIDQECIECHRVPHDSY